MCGGCGQPLYAVAGPVGEDRAVTEPDLSWTIPRTGAPPAISSPGRQMPVPPGVYPTPAGATRAPERHRRAWWQRALLVGLSVLLVLSSLGVLAWVVMLRPAIHSRLDAELRNRLTAAVEQVPSLSPGTYPISATTVTKDLHPAPQSPLKDPRIHFQSGRLILSYTLYGTGSISTMLMAQNGRLIASNTIVDGSLSLVESGDEIQAAINDALVALPASDRVRTITASNDLLVVTLV